MRCGLNIAMQKYKRRAHTVHSRCAKHGNNCVKLSQIVAQAVFPSHTLAIFNLRDRLARVYHIQPPKVCGRARGLAMTTQSKIGRSNLGPCEKFVLHKITHG